jgi:hypothetical protein
VPNRLTRLLDSPRVALIAGLILGATAFSPQASVTASRVVLVLAWLLLLYSLRGLPRWASGVWAIIATIGFLMLAYYLNPEVVAKYAGMPPGKRESLFSSGGPNILATWEIGDSDAYLNVSGTTNKPGQPVIGFFQDSNLKVQRINGKLAVSTQVRDEHGELIAELVENEWKVAPPPGTFDRNYNNNALEVKNSAGRIVLQVQIFESLIRIQGEWWDKSGQGIRLVKSPFPSRSAMIFKLSTSMPNINDNPILPMFKYPSASHFGELVGSHSK